MRIRVAGRWRGTIGAALVAALMALPAAAQAEPNYVALGDSYAAGPVIPMQVPPYGCLKSSSNYANLVALRIALPLRDVTCSGAQTKHMTEPQGVTPGPNPPQFGALDTDTRLVTLHIGGNDIGFSSIAEECFATQPEGEFCRPKFVVNGVDQVSTRIAQAGLRVAAVLDGIRARSPQARILVLDYPAIFPHQGTGCWPLLPVASGDVPWLRAKQEELNAMLAAQAASHGAVLVPVYAASRGRDACAPPIVRWVEPLVPVNAAAPVHPNLTGMLGMADMVMAQAQAPAATTESTPGAAGRLGGSAVPRF